MAAVRILIVEDEVDVSAVIQSFLGKKGFLVFATTSGMEALSLIKTFEPDLILLDMTLLDVNGIDVLKALRAHDQKTKVILTTGQKFSQEEINTINALGISAHLSKPLILEKMESLIYAAIGCAAKEDLSIGKENHVQETSKISLNNQSHELANLLNIIRTQCEHFLLNMEEGFYKDKSSDELVQLSIEIMKNVNATVDRAVGILDQRNKRA